MIIKLNRIREFRNSMTSQNFDLNSWQVEKIAVIGPGIVGMPMAALLAQTRIHQASDKPSKVVVIQRDSPTSGWKVDAINSGQSPIGGIEPGLSDIVKETVTKGILSASHDYRELRDADVILICVQTDKKGFAPDYGPLYKALDGIAQELQKKPVNKKPLLIFESTLAPSSMVTVIKDHFARCGLIEGKDIFLGNSPNRVMPGYLIERIKKSDKIIGGLHPITPELIKSLYANIVEEGTLHTTNSITAEIVKTLENTYRDVRIAFAAEIARYCDFYDIDFYKLRDEVNERLHWSDTASKDLDSVPMGALLIPTIGVGGHCLPKDGILLLWRKIETGKDLTGSLILEARRINDESPSKVVHFIEDKFGDLEGKHISLLGVAYKANSEDTRNSPTLEMARLLLKKCCRVTLHDPFVRPNDQNLIRYDYQEIFTSDMKRALEKAEIIILCAAHKIYADEMNKIINSSYKLTGLFDGCNLIDSGVFEKADFAFAGIAKGKYKPREEFIDFVQKSFLTVEIGFANEIKNFIDFVNKRFAPDEFNRVDYHEVQRIAGTCITGCRIVDPGPLMHAPSYNGFTPRLVTCAETISSWQNE